MLQLLKPLLVPLCFVAAWGFVLALGWTIAAAFRDTSQRAKLMHQIPCPHCQFFTNDHRLKCAVRPAIANTEEAIQCNDYCPRSLMG